MKIQRITALLIMVIPGVLGMYGWKLMRDTIMNNMLDPDISFHWGLFILGLFLFLLALLFIGGFIFYRDKKRKLVQKRFLDEDD